MNKKIATALISVFYKDGLAPIVQTLHQQGVIFYSTGGTRQFIESLGIPCVPVEEVTQYPSILGGRVKTLHPKIFGGILGRRSLEADQTDMQTWEIPALDLVMVDLYPFEETVASTQEEALIIEKIDIGGPSMIRAAAKNFQDVTIIASREDYALFQQQLEEQNGILRLDQRRQWAARAFDIVLQYDQAIAHWFNPDKTVLRYGENPHQQAVFNGRWQDVFEQLHGKELSYNNLVDIDAALQLLAEFKEESGAFFGIVKHTNVCGAAIRSLLSEAWQDALSGDAESAFGGILFCNKTLDEATAHSIQDIFFEVLLAPAFSPEALQILQQKKNRILLRWHTLPAYTRQTRSLLNGRLEQDMDAGLVQRWEECGGRECTPQEQRDLAFANIICKHLKSNAIALVNNQKLIGKGCGQTSRVDALRQALEKARQFKASTEGAVLASDAFFPFDDCVRMAHEAGIQAFIQPGGSIRDQDSILYCKEHQLVMVLTGMRHFKH